MSKIKIRAGEIEIEYEGAEELTKQDLVDLISQVSELQKMAPKITSVVTEIGGNAAPVMQKPTNGQSNLPKMTTKMIAQKLDVKSCKDLAFAASVQLGLLQGKSSFARKDILTEMQTAASYYTSTMSSNLSKALNSLTSNGLLNESSEHVFALTAKGEQEAGSKIA